MDKYSIRITRQARAHLREIRKYIENELMSPSAAKNTIAAIKGEMLSLEIMPQRIRLTPEKPWSSQGIRRKRAKNFYIYFWIDEEQKKVQIIGVVYVRRDQSKQLDLMSMNDGTSVLHEKLW